MNDSLDFRHDDSPRRAEHVDVAYPGRRLRSSIIMGIMSLLDLDELSHEKSPGDGSWVRAKVMQTDFSGHSGGRMIRLAQLVVGVSRLQEVEVPQHQDLGAERIGLSTDTVGMNHLSQPIMMLAQEAKVMDPIRYGCPAI